MIIGRIAAVDFGTRRIGLAVSDSAQSIATPAETILATGRTDADANRIAEWARQNRIATIVVGLPLNMNDSAGPQAKRTLRFVEALRRASGLTVETWDERLTSFQADRWLHEQGVPRRARKSRRDPLAALAILQSFLQSHRTQRETDGAEQSVDET